MAAVADGDPEWRIRRSGHGIVCGRVAAGTVRRARMAPSDWTQTLSLLHRYGGMKTVKPARDYYTDAYLPAS